MAMGSFPKALNGYHYATSDVSVTENEFHAVLSHESIQMPFSRYSEFSKYQTFHLNISPKHFT